MTIADAKNYQQERRYGNRGSIDLFAPMVDFNIMSEVGKTPP
ncbi:hypothetical protein [Chroococcidiopsis sp [FACHB-1243]]|nr:hypothetical protein [Chroococcidiopsis sp. [FACHB-1243]]